MAAEETLEQKAERLAWERAAGFVARARAAAEQRDGAGVQRLCSAALQLVPGHTEAADLLRTANPHGWSCQCKPCAKGILPEGPRAVGGPVEDVPQGDGKKAKA